MSDELPTLSDSIGQALAEALNGKCFVTAWHLSVEYIDNDGDPCWSYATPDEQRQSQTIGLIEWARGVARYEQARYLDSIGEQ